VDDLKVVIAKNITDLRKRSRMTQLELAQKLNYSDKAVSKWERAESVPDVAILKGIADLFGVTVDYLLTAEHEHTVLPAQSAGSKSRSRAIITGLCVLLVWMVATLAFVTVSLILPAIGKPWIAFIWAVPLSFVVWLIMNSIWFNSRRNYLIISCLMWATLAAVHISLLFFSLNIWLIYILGVPGQAIVLLWSGVRERQEK